MTCFRTVRANPLSNLDLDGVSQEIFIPVSLTNGFEYVHGTVTRHEKRVREERCVALGRSRLSGWSR